MNDAELSPERYRELAATSLKRAQAAKTQPERRYFVEQAAIWQRLADAQLDDEEPDDFSPSDASPGASQRG
jgi:hypothetical protein